MLTGEWMRIINKHMEWKKRFYRGFITVFRGVAISVTLLMILLLIRNVGWLHNKVEQYTVYRDLKNYYGVSISPDIDMSDENMQKLDDALVSFFRETNGDRSILFSPGNQVSLYNDGFISKEELDVKDYVITVNETYLRKYPIFDIEGRKIEITGDKRENYLLVPVEHQDISPDIKAYYEENNTFLRYYIDDLKTMDIESAHNQRHETVPLNIIFIANGQTHNAPGLGERGKLKGVINNSLVDIVTTENVSIAQIPNYVTSKDYLIKVDSPEEMESVKKIMDETGLDDYIMQFAPVSGQYFEELWVLVKVILIQLIIAIVMQCFMYLMEKSLVCNEDWRKIVRCVAVSWCIALCLIICVYGDMNVTLILSMMPLFLLDTLVIRHYRKFDEVS